MYYFEISLLLLIIPLVLFVSFNRSWFIVKGVLLGMTAGVTAGYFSGITLLSEAIGAILGGTIGSIICFYIEYRAEKLKREITQHQIENLDSGMLITFDSRLIITPNASTPGYERFNDTNQNDSI